MLLKRKYIKLLYEGLQNVSVDDRFIMYLTEKNKEILKPEYSGISTYLKTQITNFSEYEQKLKKIMNENVDAKTQQFKSDKTLDFNIDVLNLKIQYKDIVKQRHEEQNDAELFLNKETDVNIESIDIDDVQNFDQLTFNNMIFMITSNFKTNTIKLSRHNCKKLQSLIPTLNFSKHDKYKLAFNYHQFNYIQQQIDKFEDEFDELQIYDFEKYKLLKIYSKIIDQQTILTDELTYTNELNKIKQKFNFLDNIKKLDQYLQTIIEINLYTINNDDIPQNISQNNYEILFPLIN